eukprot:2892264-Pyramimonas_sp.AAC.1
MESTDTRVQMFKTVWARATVLRGALRGKVGTPVSPPTFPCVHWMPPDSEGPLNQRSTLRDIATKAVRPYVLPMGLRAWRRAVCTRGTYDRNLFSVSETNPHRLTPIPQCRM